MKSILSEIFGTEATGRAAATPLNMMRIFIGGEQALGGQTGPDAPGPLGP